jgi:antitoxin (DNA-binding transcriptional repressor) of toxin-antitoxin stability system
VGIQRSPQGWFWARSFPLPAPAGSPWCHESYYLIEYDCMKTVTSTELARNLRRILDSLSQGGEDYLIVRNNEPLGKLIPGPAKQSAMEAMADLYRTLPPKAAQDWVEEGRAALPDTVAEGIRDPWDS